MGELPYKERKVSLIGKNWESRQKRFKGIKILIIPMMNVLKIRTFLKIS